LALNRRIAISLIFSTLASARSARVHVIKVRPAVGPGAHPAAPVYSAVVISPPLAPRAPRPSLHPPYNKHRTKCAGSNIRDSRHPPISKITRRIGTFRTLGARAISCAHARGIATKDGYLGTEIPHSPTPGQVKTTHGRSKK
jgi:hypothetical protein